MKTNLILLFTIIQCVHLLAQPCDSNTLLNRSIKASQTDNNIAWELQEHQVWINPDCIQNDKLVLHLVGSFDNPSNTTFFPILAANNGFKAINLKYPNGTAAATACANSNDNNCFTGFREEIIFGTDSSTTVDVDSNNSIINRIEKLLIHLHDNYPSENWDMFLNPTGGINWSNIIVSGHSQGGGHAAYLGKEFEVERVLMFASPNDYSTFFSTPASWLSNPSATAESNYFGFGNFFDNVVDFSHQFENWSAMNLLVQTDSINIDISNCNYNNSNVLYTRFNPFGLVQEPHSNMIRDGQTPLTGGVPNFTPVWEYMLGICEETTPITDIKNQDSKINLFPNPVSSILQIESNSEISKVEIYNWTGTLVQTIYPNQKEFDLNVESYQGVLFLKMIAKDAAFEICKKIIVY